MADLTFTTAEMACLHAEGTFSDASTGAPVPLTWEASDPAIEFIVGEGANVWIGASAPVTATVTASSGSVSKTFEVEATEPASPPARVLVSIEITVLEVRSR